MRSEEKVMGALADFVIRYHKVIPIVGLILFVPSIIAASTIKVKTQIKDLLPEDNPQVKSFEETYTGDEADEDIDSSKQENEAVAQLNQLEWFFTMLRNVIEMGDLSVAGLGEENKILEQRNQMIREIFGPEVGKSGEEVFQKLIQRIEFDSAVYAERLSRLDFQFARETVPSV